MNPFIGLLPALLAASFSVVTGGPLVLKPAADTSIVQEQPGNNYGHVERLYVGVAQEKNSHALVRFDLSSIPATGQVVYATLSLQPTSLLGGSYELRRVLTAWGEGDKAGSPASQGEATWIAARTGESNWAVPGGTLGTDFATTSSATATSAGASMWFVPSSAELEEWRQFPQNNFGWVLQKNLSSGQSSSRVSFYSSETGSASPELKVYLGDPNAPRIINSQCSLTACGFPPVLLDSSGLIISDKGIQLVLESPFNTRVFYTLDGSQPTLNSAFLNSGGSLNITSNVILRAFNYSADFSKSGETPPIPLTVKPTYSITLNPPGWTYLFGATAPQSNEHFEGTVVRVLATPEPPFSFIQWRGDVADPFSPDTTTVANSNKVIQAVFGGPVQLIVQGQGTLVTDPPGGPFELGVPVRITPIPAPGYYFAQWGGSVSGNRVPAEVTIYTSTPLPVVSALFLPLGPDQTTLRVRAEGGGTVRTPAKNVYSSSEIVTLTAEPREGFSFIGWSGDASGTTNPLSLQLRPGSMQVTALFTGRTSLGVTQVNAQQISITFNTEPGFAYTVQSSPDLRTWSDVETIANSNAPASKVYQVQATNLFYRVKVDPAL